MRRNRCVLRLKCRRLDGLDVVGKNTGRIEDYAEQLGGYRCSFQCGEMCGWGGECMTEG